jgi:hypothetical protein
LILRRLNPFIIKRKRAIHTGKNDALHLENNRYAYISDTTIMK